MTGWLVLIALWTLAGYWAWRRAGRKNAAKRLARREAGERIMARILGKS